MVTWREWRERMRFWREADNLGPDIPTTHWRLHFKSTMRELCTRKFAAFGEDSEFRPGAYAFCCSRIRIGERVTIRPMTVLAADPLPGGAGIVIEDDVLLGPGIKMFVHDHAFGDPDALIVEQGYTPSEQITIRRGAWLGTNVVVLKGVEIGENAVVGAGAVVTRDVPPRTVVAGNPARVIRGIDAEPEAAAPDGD